MTAPHPLGGLKVVELSEDPGGEFAGRQLVGLGCEVTKVEPPGGSASRRVGPFAQDRQDSEHSLNFWFYNPGKKSVVADLATPEGMAAFKRMLARADILLAGYQPAALRRLGLDYEALLLEFPRLIIVSVTPFGLTGPWADYLSSDMLALAAAGPMHVCGYDDHTLPPVRHGGNQGYHTAAAFAVSGALTALLQRDFDGGGQLVDVSMHEANAITVEFAFHYWEYQRALLLRQTCRHAQPAPTQPALFASGDGRYIYFMLVVAEEKPWRMLVEWLEAYDMAADLADPVYRDMMYRQENFDHIQAIVECFFLTMTAEQAFQEGQARQLPVGVLYAPEDILEDRHLAARGFWVEAEGPDGPVIHPGTPYRFSALDVVPAARSPRLGEHGVAARAP